MLDNDTPDLGAGYDRTAVDGDTAADTTPVAEGDNADSSPAENTEVETLADADTEADTTEDTAPADAAADAA